MAMRSLSSAPRSASAARAAAARPAPRLAARAPLQQRRRAVVAVAAAVGKGDDVPHVQLGTAKLPADCQVPVFVESLYQWAATLTQSGANFPTSLPLKVDKLGNGFTLSMLKRVGKVGSGKFDSAGDIQATVEQDASDNILVIRFYEGPATFIGYKKDPPAGPGERLDIALASLVDVDTIMNTMPNAIAAAAKASK